VSVRALSCGAHRTDVPTTLAGQGLIIVPRWSTADEGQRARGAHIVRDLPDVGGWRPTEIETIDFGTDIKALIDRMEAGDALYVWPPFDRWLESLKHDDGSPRFRIISDKWKVETALYCSSEWLRTESGADSIQWLVSLLIRQWQYISANRLLAREAIVKDGLFPYAFAGALSVPVLGPGG